MERVINGVTCRSYLYDLQTGEKVPYEKSMAHRIHKSILMQMTAAELMALPKAPKDMKPTAEILLYSDGRKEWRDIPTT